MSLIIKKEESTYKALEAGTYPGRCVGLIDLGLQETPKFENKNEFEVSQRIIVIFELPEEKGKFEIEGQTIEKIRTISREFKVSLNEKASLRKLLATWRGRDFTEEELQAFNLSKLLDVPAIITLSADEKDGRTYNNIVAISSPIKGMIIPARISEITQFDLDESSEDDFKKLPNYIKEKIKKGINCPQNLLLIDKN